MTALAMRSASPVLLGSTVDADGDATPTPNADGDIGDDGRYVRFSAESDWSVQSL